MTLSSFARLRALRGLRGAALTLTTVAGLTAAAVVPATASSSSAPAPRGIVVKGTVYDHPASKSHPSLSIGSPQLDGVLDGPWTTSQGDPTEGTPYSPGLLLPSYTPGGATTTVGGVTEPNLAVYPGANAGSGTPPYASGTAGTPGPVPGYCSSGGPNPESGPVNREPTNEILPMSPYYFPDIVRNSDGSLTGYFDYRPKDTDEAIVAAKSLDGGHTWTFEGEALEQNPGYCPSGDTNDNGQGHPFVLTIKGKTFMYTVDRPAGDSQGVNLLVNRVQPNAANPLANLPADQSVGTGPDTSAAAPVSVPTTGSTGATIPLTTLGTGPEEIGAPGAPLVFEDLSASSPASSVITCTSVPGTALNGCTTAAPGGLTVNQGDSLVEALSTVTTAVDIPQGPQNAGGTAGAAVSITVPASTIASLFNANLPGRFYIDGATVYCLSVDSTNDTLSGCTTTQSGGVSVNAGDALTTDPIVPVSATQTTGLTAPDGMVGTLSNYPGAPAGSTVVVYGEKILNYFDPTVTTNTAPIVLSATSGVTIPVV
ncbi:MAG TPA: hypothetical protein VK784_02145, partial [Pseudonocardiaceae bacterium]|nr:hypothetical protein [Pseudonocardiaceae bacterium]